MKLILITVATFFNVATAQTTRSGQTFNKIVVKSNAKIILRTDSMCSYRFTETDNLTASQTKVVDGTLIINSIPAEAVVVTLPTLNEVVIDGVGSVVSETIMHGGEMRFVINGNGKIEAEVSAEKVNATIAGIGKINLKGTAEQANYNISGSGKIDGKELRTVTSNVKIGGIGKVYVDATDQLNADISGNGKVIYKTEPKNITKNITGEGTVKGDDEDVMMTSDTTKIELGKRQLWVIGPKDSLKAKKKKAEPIWSGLELGINSYLNHDGTFSLPSGLQNWELRAEKSVSVALNLFQFSRELGHSNVWFVSGLGMTWNNYRFENDVVLQNGSYITAIKDTTSGVRHLKSKLVTSYLTVPVMLQVLTSRNQKKAFHISAGAMLGLRIGSHTKQKIDIDGDVSKIKEHDNFNLNPFRYGMRVSVGYGKFNVFADYYASSLFRNNKGPALYPVNAGITVVGF